MAGRSPAHDSICQSARAVGPRMDAAGEPGVSCIIEKTINVTQSRTGIVISRRFKTYFSISFLLLKTEGPRFRFEPGDLPLLLVTSSGN